jgi:hypothetical protein
LSRVSEIYRTCSTAAWTTCNKTASHSARLHVFSVEMRRTVHNTAVPLATANGVIVFGIGSTVSAFSEKRWTQAPQLWLDAESHKSNRIIAVAAHLSGIALSSDDNGNVFLHEKVTDASQVRHKRLCRASTPIRCIDITADGERAVLGGDGVKVIHLRDMIVNVISVPLPPTIVAVAASPCGMMVACGSNNRSVAVSPLAEGAPKAILQSVLASSIRSTDAIDVKLWWTPDSKLCVPVPEGVRIYHPRSEGLVQIGTIQLGRECVAVLGKQFSKNLLTMLIGTADGKVLSLRTDASKKFKVVRGPTEMSDVSAAFWSVDAERGTLYACNDTGITTQVAKAVRVNSLRDVPTTQGATQQDEDSDASENLVQVVDDLVADNPGYKEKSHKRRQQDHRGATRPPDVFGGLIDDEAEVSDDASDDDGPDEAESHEEDPSNDDDDEVREAPSVASDEHHFDQVQHRFTHREHPVVAIGATSSDDAGRQYLAFTSVGAVRRTAESGVSVAFYDKSRGLMKVPHKGHCTHAAIGTHGVSFVFRKEEGSLATTDVVYKTFGTATSGATDWVCTLPTHERVRVLAQCKRFTVVFTEDYMRVFGSGGVEMIVACFTNVIAATGLNTVRAAAGRHESADPLAVVTTHDGELRLAIYDVEQGGSPLEHGITMPLTHAEAEEPQSLLRWMGWSDDGYFAYQDTRGTVRMLTHDWGTSWLPILDIRVQSELTGAWVWGATEDKLWCFMCGSQGAEPSVTPELPPPDFVSMMVPLVRSAGTDRAVTFRQHHMRLTAKLNDVKRQSEIYTETLAKKDADLDRILLKMFESELRNPSECIGRCIDIATQFQLVAPSLELAIRMAHEANQTFLCERLVAIADSRVKTKRRRLCTLPLENVHVTDREKERLLRRLLAKERAGTQAENAGEDRQHVPLEPKRGVGAKAPAAAAVEIPPVAKIPSKPMIEAPTVAHATNSRASVPTQNEVRKSFNPFATKAEPLTAEPKSTAPVMTSVVAPPGPRPPTPAKKIPPQAVEASVVATTPKRPAGPATTPSPSKPRPIPDDPFLTHTQATEAVSDISWRGMEAPKTGFMPLPVDAPSDAVAAAIHKRYRQEDSDNSDDEEARRGLGRAFARVES